MWNANKTKASFVFNEQTDYLLPLYLVVSEPSGDSCVRTCTEFVLVTSTPTIFGGSGGLVRSQPRIIRRIPLTRRSHMPSCFSTSLELHPDNNCPDELLPANRLKIQNKK